MAAPPPEARFWSRRDDGRVECALCPHACRIAEGRTGICGVRRNDSGTLRALTYGRAAAVHVDPIEKKPLFHFMPGSRILSIGMAGCNLTCSFCQNWTLSRASPDDLPGDCLAPPDAVALARRARAPSIAFTYNEPTVSAEYVMDTAALASEAGLRSVMVTNGYVRLEAVPDLYRHVDAANVDLKAFTDDFYRRHAGARLQPVLDAAVAMAAAGTFLEVTTLVIPGLNSEPSEIAVSARWIRDNLGADTPLHLSAFHPDYRMTDRPATPPAMLAAARDAARDAGLRFVYEGNVRSDGCNTVCPSCGRTVVRRAGNEVTAFDLDAEDRCACGAVIPIRR
ncbi:MAG: AmmeMemoRadiSam system radical SAM enzyme [Deltaproteobacteria bacterium]|nr:AmmeMemoRadiSam system radical SAM enzyme [Deltaproteobacteria bacterium]